MLNQETAKAARTDSGYILRAPRRMRVADAVAQYMRVPMGAGNSVPWDPLVAPYVIEERLRCRGKQRVKAITGFCADGDRRDPAAARQKRRQREAVAFV